MIDILGFLQKSDTTDYAKQGSELIQFDFEKHEFRVLHQAEVTIRINSTYIRFYYTMVNE